MVSDQNGEIGLKREKQNNKLKIRKTFSHTYWIN